MSNRNFKQESPTPNMNDQILLLDHEIRQIEHSLVVARRRKRLSNASVALGPILALVLYGMWWIPWVGNMILWAVYLPAVPTVLAFAVAAYQLKRYPGGPEPGTYGTAALKSEGELELALNQKRDMRKSALASVDVSAKLRRITYKEEAYADINKLRLESNRYRRVNNTLQGFLIIGSLAATGASGIAAELATVRWVTLGLTFTVGISSGFMGYFKYKERSFYLQQTADAIEHEWEAVEIGVGRYKNFETEEERLAEFVEEVHRLKSEQKKRQQNLEQPADSDNSND